MGCRVSGGIGVGSGVGGVRGTEGDVGAFGASWGCSACWSHRRW